MVNAGARAGRIVAPPRDGGSAEAVFKLISSTKSRQDAKRLVRYVARVRKSDRDDPTVGTVQLRGGAGEVIARAGRGEAFDETQARVGEAFEALELTPEAENLKVRPQAARAEERLREVEEPGFVAPEPQALAAPKAGAVEDALRRHGVAEPDPGAAQQQALGLALLDVERERERAKRARRRRAEQSRAAGEVEDPDEAAGLEAPEPAAGPDIEDLRHRQVYHFTFSTPLARPGDPALFELAVEAAVEENFTDRGHRALWAVHGGGVKGEGESPHGHAHAHIVVKARNEDTGRYLNIGRHEGARDVRDLRESFAEHAREVGLTAEATWREDRAEVRDAVAGGTEVLRPHRDHRRSTVGRQAPDWALAYEPSAIARREVARSRRKAGEPAWPEAPVPAQGLERLRPPRRRRRRGGAGPAQARLEARLEGHYEDAGGAVDAWRELRTELETRPGGDPSYADWWLAKRPEAFGEPLAAAFGGDGAGARAGDRDFRRLLREAAAEMPPALPPQPDGPEGTARRAAKASLDERLAGATAVQATGGGWIWRQLRPRCAAWRGRFGARMRRWPGLCTRRPRGPRCGPWRRPSRRRKRPAPQPALADVPAFTPRPAARNRHPRRPSRGGGLGE